MPTRIDVRELKAGMTVMTETGPGQFKPECRLVRHFTTSTRFPELAFVTERGNNVVWRPCGYVWIK